MISNKTKILSIVAVGVCALAGMVLVGLNANIGSYQNEGDFLNLKSKDNDSRLNFQKFIVKHRKNYLTREEYEARFSIFKQTLQFIREFGNDT
jgi:cytochrome c-type biogenesis protein CcmE